MATKHTINTVDINSMNINVNNNKININNNGKDIELIKSDRIEIWSLKNNNYIKKFDIYQIKKLILIILIIFVLITISTSILSIQYYDSISSLCLEFKNYIKFVYICAILNIFLTIICVILCGILLSGNIKKHKYKNISIHVLTYIFIFAVGIINAIISYNYLAYLGTCTTNENFDYHNLYYYNLVSYTACTPISILLIILFYFILNK
jgi:hypothetical protein